MDDNPIKDTEENVMFETPPEVTPPGAADFSMQKAQKEFLGGGASKEVVPAKSPSDPLVDLFKQVDLESGGALLTTLTKRDGSTVSFMKIPERSFDKHPEISLFGFDDQGFLRTTGPLAEEIIARLNTKPANQEASQSFEDIAEQFSGVIDEQGRGSKTVRIMPEMDEEKQRMQKNLKMNLLNVQIGMNAKSILVNEFDVFGKPLGSAVGAREALARATQSK